MASAASGLNAPSGAGCFLTGIGALMASAASGLNAPSGAGCFLTVKPVDDIKPVLS